MRKKNLKKLIASALCMTLILGALHSVAFAISYGSCTCTEMCFDWSSNPDCEVCYRGSGAECRGRFSVPDYTGDGTIDAASGPMSAMDLAKTFAGALKKFDTITIILPPDADEDMFSAISFALQYVMPARGSVSLTVLGALNVPDFAFDFCVSLGSISMPSAENIGMFAFADTDLVTVYLPNAKTIGAYAFQNCREVKSLTLGVLTSVDHSNYGIFHGASGGVNEIDLTLTCGQKEMTRNGDYWQAGTANMTSEGKDFIGYTFRSISVLHTVDPDTNKCNCNVTYTASGNVITESCPTCDHKETATLNVPTDALIYDGTEKTAGTVAYSDGWQGGALDISYSNNIFPGTASASITKDGATASVTFGIDNADQSAPSVGKVDETISGKNDGKITGVDETMEYRLEGETLYKAITGNVIENLPDGKYYVRLKAKENFNPSPDTEVIIAEGRKNLTVTFNPNGGAAIDPISVTIGEKYGRLPSSAILGLSGGDSNWYLVDENGNVTDTKIKNLTVVSAERDHALFLKRTVLAPTVTVKLTVPGGISDGYQYYIPGASERVLTVTVGNMNTDILEYTYKWYKDGTLIDGETSSVLTLDGNVSDSGTYKVEVTATLKDGAGILVTSNSATASKEQKVKILHATNTLSYDANGGENGPQSSYSGGATISVSDNEPNREHYTFIGWNTLADGSGDSYKANDTYTFSLDNGNGGCVVTLYAQWQINEYTITFIGENGVHTTLTQKYGETVTMPEAPEKDGYTVTWDTVIDTVTGNATVTAVYTKIPQSNPNTFDSGLIIWVAFALIFGAGTCFAIRKKRFAKVR